MQRGSCTVDRGHGEPKVKKNDPTEIILKSIRDGIDSSHFLGSRVLGIFFIRSPPPALPLANSTGLPHPPRGVGRPAPQRASPPSGGEATSIGLSPLPHRTHYPLVRVGGSWSLSPAPGWRPGDRCALATAGEPAGDHLATIWRPSGDLRLATHWRLTGYPGYRLLPGTMRVHWRPLATLATLATWRPDYSRDWSVRSMLPIYGAAMQYFRINIGCNALSILHGTALYFSSTHSMQC